MIYTRSQKSAIYYIPGIAGLAMTPSDVWDSDIPDGPYDASNSTVSVVEIHYYFCWYLFVLL